MISRNKRLAVFIVVFSVLLSSFAYYAFQIIYTPNVLVDQQERYLTIYSETTFSQLQDQLINEGFVQDLVSFSFLAKLMKYDEHIKPGLYVISPNQSNYNVIRMLRAGEQTPVQLTFNNIRTLDDLVTKVANQLEMSEEKLLQILNDQHFISDLGFTPQSILGMFIPDTYEVYWTISPRALVKKMKKQYDSFWNNEREAKASKLGLNKREVTVLASIVKAETTKNDEAPKIAGVYLNRLKKGMRLQADPTIIFALGDFSIKRVLNEHKQLNSPYNTYLHVGLPPGPINMPEEVYLDAVLNYESHNYLYFCAKPDFSGYHSFASSYRKHINNANAYHRALNRNNIF